MTPTQVNYRQLLRDPKWQRKRNGILQRDKYACTKCGDTETNLQVHHLRYVNNPWDAADEDMITLCEHCHIIYTKITVILPKVKIFKILKIKAYIDSFTAFVFTDNCLRLLVYNKGVLTQPYVFEYNVTSKLMHALIDFHMNEDCANKL